MNASGTILQNHITDLDPGDFGHARARAVEHQEERVITPADSSFVRRVDYGQHLLAGQIAKHQALETSHGYAERAFDHLQRRHIPAAGELEEWD